MRRADRFLLALPVAVVLAGCNLAPAYKVPATPVAEQYKDIGPWVQAQPADQLPRTDWWSSYGDHQLDQLQQRLLAHNADLAAALAHYRQAQALFREARSGYFPQIGASAGAVRQRQSDTAPMRSPTAPADYDTYTAGAQLSYEVDLWGHVRDTVAAGRDEAQATAADLASVQLSLQAQLADDYLALRGLDQQLQLLQQSVDAYRKALQLTQTLHSGGIVSGLDVARAQTQLSTVKSQWAQTAAQRAEMQDAIAVLVGESASQFTLPSQTAAVPLPPIPLAVPSTLLQRRPDIAAAERRTAEANAEIGVARSAYFPSLTLDAQGGFLSKRYADLLTAPNHVWALGPSLLFDLFDGGMRKAQVAAAKAAADEAGAKYRGVVLGAFQQVEDNLALLDRLSAAMVDQQAAAVAAQHALDLAMKQYKVGAASYLDVVQSQTAALQAQSSVLNLGTQQLRASVQLIRALGGGWSREQLAQKPAHDGNTTAGG
ncbi:efflux transporter outer membrane subunit [Rhodanobacter sp. 7MK24]|uniref:efflux transporter outer membrane subunit n=1 Tax=Rhodanobacter sp. 7MK24 TaxID=2775922 RepID=UPI0017843886|nr:efflux transporter outer membrane subunit [Rhodanobacter sp. 7MK24]MBD8882404.1 efflux transporter outer membrane subunit [Rhodanobacter sp. 7MK24]